MESRAGLRVRFTLAAEADIALMTKEGVRLFGTAQAEIYAKGLGQAFELIGQFPFATPQHDYFRQPVRARSYGSHIILYVAEESEVLILRVRHGREDWAED